MGRVSFELKRAERIGRFKINEAPLQMMSVSRYKSVPVRFIGAVYAEGPGVRDRHQRSLYYKAFAKNGKSILTAGSGLISAERDQTDDLLETGRVNIAKIVEFVAVYIQHTDHVLVTIEYRHDDLRFRCGTARNMAGKRIDIRHDRCRGRRVRMAADAFAKLDSRAGERALKWPENELTVLSQIESDPKESKCFL